MPCFDFHEKTSRSIAILVPLRYVRSTFALDDSRTRGLEEEGSLFSVAVDLYRSLPVWWRNWELRELRELREWAFESPGTRRLHRPFARGAMPRATRNLRLTWPHFGRNSRSSGGRVTSEVARSKLVASTFAGRDLTFLCEAGYPSAQPVGATLYPRWKDGVYSVISEESRLSASSQAHLNKVVRLLNERPR